ncbi:MAG TPA: hypothetical protein VFO10_27655 [Oligoflexus sp.]|uniref:hypothetical protein n=1 Tax=Oligoflexus sp. TaxID=1971216 RepID=UPI002D7FDCE7|nr:hypothetical protein [Oligoflexus sp.]HET9241072.1 hypothetical protein [Oligoflexus sp.]
MNSALKALMCLLLFTIFVKNPQAGAQDLPPQGASFFDSMQSTVGIIYDGKPLPLEPHPFEALLKKLNQHSTFFTSVVPFGRSLQKMAAYPQSLKYPRVLVATSEISKDMNTHFRGRLFIAYVEAARKLEVISYNPIMGRYEFQIVDNFHPGGKAQARYMPRNLCLRCHQGGTPIFAGGEWLETTAFNPELLKLAQAAIGSKDYLGIPLARDDASSKYELIPKPEHFEDMVRFGALLIGYQKAWQDLCSSNRNKVQCKKKLLKWMLVTNLADKLSLEPDRELLRAFVSVLGKGTINVPSEMLADHNPVVNGQLSYHMPPDMDPSLPREPMQIIMASQGDPLGLQFYKFHIFIKGMGQSFFTEKDFSQIRTILGGRIEKRSQKTDADKTCLPDAGALLQSLNSPKEAKPSMEGSCFPKEAWLKFMKAIDTMPLTANSPLSRETILEELDKRLGTQYANGLCCRTKLMPAVQKEAEKKTRLDPGSFKDQRLQSFVRFCSECHLYQDLPPPFLAGENEREVLENIRKKAELIQFRLENKQMPPQFARHSLTSQERQDLLRDLKRISAHD